MSESTPSLYDNIAKEEKKRDDNEDDDDNQKENTCEPEEEPEEEVSALASFAHATRFMTRIGTFRTGALEPLPFTDYSLFEDTYNIDALNINVNLLAGGARKTFLPNTPIRVRVTATKKKDLRHIIHPYM